MVTYISYISHLSQMHQSVVSVGLNPKVTDKIFLDEAGLTLSYKKRPRARVWVGCTCPLPPFPNPLADPTHLPRSLVLL